MRLAILVLATFLVTACGGEATESDSTGSGGSGGTPSGGSGGTPSSDGGMGGGGTSSTTCEATQGTFEQVCNGECDTLADFRANDCVLFGDYFEPHVSRGCGFVRIANYDDTDAQRVNIYKEETSELIFASTTSGAPCDSGYFDLIEAGDEPSCETWEKVDADAYCQPPPCPACL